jgi:4-diphosphocytidyl-2-C-methyl-D-erythritol kinase
VKLLAPAKINLHLRVAPATADGFHPLLSWMCTIGLFDTLLIERDGEAGFRLSCDDPSLPCDATNLVVRAAMAMHNVRQSGAPPLGGSLSRAIGEGGLAMQLQKRIPMGGGLGGGSSDAARVVQGLNHLWQLGLSVEQLSAVCATLGSDVAFFCHGPSSVCSGRGQIVRPIGLPAARWVLLILPPISVPTGPVYRRFDELLSEDDRAALANAVAVEPDWIRWQTLDAVSLLPLLVNDLERPAFDLHPDLARVRDEFEQSLGRIVRMSGSGSSLFTLFDAAEAAQQAADEINAGQPNAGHINRVGRCRAIAAMIAPPIDDELDQVRSANDAGQHNRIAEVPRV